MRAERYVYLFLYIPGESEKQLGCDVWLWLQFCVSSSSWSYRWVNAWVLILSSLFYHCRIWPVCFGHKWSHYYQLWYIGTYNAFKSSIFPFNKEIIQKQIPNLFDTHFYLSSFPGSFGLWGSLLAGGDVIAAKGTSNSTLSEEDRVYLRSGMPGWLYVDTRDQNNVRVLQVNTSNETFTPAV